jgi:hypothetical protein
MAKAKQSSVLELAFGAEKEQVSFTISADLYEEFADYAAEKQVSMAAVFRAALSDFACLKFSNPDSDAEFEVFSAKVLAQQPIEELPKLSNGNSEWMN